MNADSRKKKKRPRDLNQLATQIVSEAIDSSDEPTEYDCADNGINLKAVFGRIGGQKGGKTRAAKLTPEQRTEIARKAANARWKK